MSEYEKTLDELFSKGKQIHKEQVEGWIKGRDAALETLNWLGMTAARFESCWRTWVDVVGKRKALRACRKLKKQVSKTQAAVYQFMADAL